MKIRGRLGKYLRAALTASDAGILLFSTFVASRLLGIGWSGWRFVAINMLALIGLASYYSVMHEERIYYSDQVISRALRTSIKLFFVTAALLFLLGRGGADARLLIVQTAVFFMLISGWWILSRKILKWLRSRGVNYRSAVIVGCGEAGDALLDELSHDAGFGYRVIRFFDDSRAGMRHNGIECLPLASIENFLRSKDINYLFCADTSIDSAMMERLMALCDERGTSMVVLPRFSRLTGLEFEPATIGSFPVAVHTLSPLQKQSGRVVKRTFDVLFSLCVLALSAITMLPVALAIKLTSPGPVFFRQRRTGLYGEAFVCYKFRTMAVNEQSDFRCSTADDERTTRVGRFLRHYSIDELPQFYNVLRGQMSIVGPRPHMLSETRAFSDSIDKYMMRHAVKPGITGWAQVNGFRGGTDDLERIRGRVESDMWYIRNWNFFLDIKIIFLTVVNLLSGDDNAY